MEQNQMSAFKKIIKICFPEDCADNENNLQLISKVLQERKYANPGSLVSSIFKMMLTENLKNVDMRKEVEEFVKQNALPLSHLHYLSNYPILFDAGLITILQKFNLDLKIEIKRTNFSLKIRGQTIIELPNGEEWNMPIHFVHLVINSSFNWFCLSVSEAQNETDTRKESLSKVVAIVQQTARPSPGTCHIGCYEQRAFNFSGRNGMVMLFQKRQPHTCKVV